MADKEKDFWGKDMTTIHGKYSWFGALSAERRILYVLILLFIVFWGFFLGFVGAAALAPEWEGEIVTSADLTEEDLLPVELEGKRIVLLVGTDVREGETSARTDTIMLAFLDLDNQTVDLLSIPRDTYAQIAGTPTKTKINEAFYYGGITLTRQTIEYMLGIKIDDYVLIDFAGFAECIDAIGGVEVNVEERMYKPSENIDLQPGLQMLDGYDALAYVRFRDTVGGDIDRVARQQSFIKILADELVQLKNVFKAPQLVNIAMNNITTDLAYSEAISLVTYGLNSDLANMGTYTVPGVGMYINNISYWIVREAELRNIMIELLGTTELPEMYIIDDGGAGTYSPSIEQTDETLPETPVDTTDPSVTDPDVTDPDTTDPSVTDPDVTDPSVTDPSAVAPIDPNTIPEPD